MSRKLSRPDLYRREVGNEKILIKTFILILIPPLLQQGLKVQEGSSVVSTGKIAQIPVSDNCLGRVLNSLARPIDGKGDIEATENRLIESPAPGIISRRSVHEPLQTGLVAVDAMIPIGRGQIGPFNY